MKNYDKAIGTFNSAIELSPKNANIWILEGNSYVGLKGFEDAIICYKKALEIDPENENAKENMDIVKKLI